MALRHDLPLLRIAPPSTPAANRSAARRARLLLDNQHQLGVHLNRSGHLRSTHFPSAQPAKAHPNGTGGLRRMDTLQRGLSRRRRPPAYVFGQQVTERIGATADVGEPPVQPGWFKTLIFIYSDSHPVTERTPSRDPVERSGGVWRLQKSGTWYGTWTNCRSIWASNEISPLPYLKLAGYISVGFGCGGRI